jgi:enoyl-CoA hydratase/carnithine racemase
MYVDVRELAGCWEVTLNRPEALNAINAAMRDELVEICAAARLSSVTVVLRGRGRAFCAGGDLNEFGLTRDTGKAHLVRSLRSLPFEFLHLGARLVACVHGACYGAGLELAAFATYVVCEPEATFCLPELRYGLIPGAGGTVSVSRRIGRRQTLQLCLEGRVLRSDEALGLGLVDRVVTTSELDEAALSFARQLSLERDKPASPTL